MSELKNSNATFLVIFNHRDVGLPAKDISYLSKLLAKTNMYDRHPLLHLLHFLKDQRIYGKQGCKQDTIIKASSDPREPDDSLGIPWKTGKSSQLSKMCYHRMKVIKF